MSRDINRETLERTVVEAEQRMQGAADGMARCASAGYWRHPQMQKYVQQYTTAVAERDAARAGLAALDEIDGFGGRK